MSDRIIYGWMCSTDFSDETGEFQNGVHTNGIVYPTKGWCEKEKPCTTNGDGCKAVRVEIRVAASQVEIEYPHMMCSFGKTNPHAERSFREMFERIRAAHEAGKHDAPRTAAAPIVLPSVLKRTVSQLTIRGSPSLSWIIHRNVT